MALDPRLRDFAQTDRQREIFDAVLEHGSQRRAATALGVRKSTVDRSIGAVRKHAAARGLAPDNDYSHPVPDGFTVKGVSTLYDEDGKVRAQWVKSRADNDEKLDAFKDMLADLCEQVQDKSIPTPAPPAKFDEIVTVYPMGDPHCGLYAWAEESGEDFNLEIWQSRLMGAVDRLVDAAPASELGIFVNLGDFFHADDSRNQTPASGHALDVDTRYAKVAMVGFRTMVYALNRLKDKHAKVLVINKGGNHDPHSYLMLAMALNAYFNNDPRVEVPVDPCMFSYHQFGKCLFGWTHGHGPKLHELPMLMATDRPKEWGDTTLRVWHVGHFHHSNIKRDLTGCEVEIVRTLAGSDQWHHGKGYRSKKDMQAIVYHKDGYEVERHTRAA